LLGRSQTTRDTYEQRLNLFCQFLIENKLTLNIQEINKRHIKEFQLYLLDRKTKQGNLVKDSLRNAYYRCLHSFFEWAKDEDVEILERSPMEGMHPPAYTKAEIKPFSVSDIESLLLLCKGNTFIVTRNKSLILVDMDTALRLEELTEMMVDDIDMETGYIHVLGKGRRRRMVRMGVRTRRVLISYLRHRAQRNKGQYKNLWLTEEGHPLTRGGIRITIERLCDRAGITDTRGSTHTFRHTGAIFSFRNGADLKDVQVMLGHARSKTTADIYLNSWDSEQAAQRHEKFSPVDNLK
jgi:site-specific recombinase XerD